MTLSYFRFVILLDILFFMNGTKSGKVSFKIVPFKVEILLFYIPELPNNSPPAPSLVEKKFLVFTRGGVNYSAAPKNVFWGKIPKHFFFVDKVGRSKHSTSHQILWGVCCDSRLRDCQNRVPKTFHSIRQC